MAITTLALLYVIIGIIVSSIVLWLVASYGYKTKNKDLQRPFFIALITGFVSYFLGLIQGEYVQYVNLAVTFILGIYLIKKCYNLKIGKTVLIWVTWFLIMVLISYVLNVLTPISFATGLIG